MAYKNRFFPHLVPDDIPVWERYLEAYGSTYDHIDYDVQVGFGQPPPSKLHRVIEKDMRHLYRRRIDAVAYRTDLITIIEITQLADLKAIGQLLAYPILYRITFQPKTRIRTLLVAEKLHTDIDIILAHMPDVEHVLLPPQAS